MKYMYVNQSRPYKFVGYKPKKLVSRSSFKCQGTGYNFSKDVKTRSKTGCLNCRKRKKKCDEVFPRCIACEKNCLDCCWPENRDSILKKRKFDDISFVVDLSDKLIESSDKTVSTDEKDEQYTKEILSTPYYTGPDTFLEDIKAFTDNEVLTTSFDLQSEADILDLHLSGGSMADSHFKNQIYYMDSSSCLAPFSTWIPHISLSPESAFLYHTFVTDFIPSVSPQLTHPNLSPQAIFVPPGATSSILREVFYTCAAAYLSWKNSEYKLISQKRYMSMISLIKQEIEAGKVDGSEDWLFVAVQCLCLREKCYGAKASKSAKHLATSFRLIRKRQQKRQSNLRYDLLRKGVHDLSGIVDDISLEDFQLDTDGITPTEKTLVESVVYNYSVSILLCEESDLEDLPSPFQIFQDFKSFLLKPIYNCPAVWMNNSVLGAGIDAFEIAAKASWLSRLKIPLDEQSLSMAESLYECAYNYICPNLPDDITRKVNREDVKSLNYSLLIAQNMARASQILLWKIIHPDVDSFDSVIQFNVNEIYQVLQIIPPSHFTNAIIGWMLVIAGACSIEEKHRNFFRKRCEDLGNTIHVQFCIGILDFFGKAWGDSSNVGKGCEILFDRDSLERINA